MKDRKKEQTRLAADCNRHRRYLILSTGALMVVGTSIAHRAFAQTSPMALSSIINRSGRLRALSQRMAKAYMQMTLGVLPDKAQEILITSQALIERTMLDLRNGPAATFPDANKVLTPLEAQAKQFLALTTQGIPAKDTSPQVAAQADILLAEAEKATRYFEGLSRSTQAKIVNISGRQRMLSQQTAKCYFLIHSGFDSKNTQSTLAKARAEFKAALETMSNAPISTKSIRQDLELAAVQWAAFEVSLDQKPNLAMFRNVATTSERLLELMDNLTNQYDQAVKEMLGSTGDDTEPLGTLDPLLFSKEEGVSS